MGNEKGYFSFKNITFEVIFLLLHVNLDEQYNYTPVYSKTFAYYDQV